MQLYSEGNPFSQEYQVIQLKKEQIRRLKEEIKNKDAEIEKLNATIEKMKCCENCALYPPQKCSFNTQYGCLDGLIPSDWKIKGTNNE